MFFDKTLNILNKILTHPALMFPTLFAKIMFVLNFSSKNLILLTLVEEFDQAIDILFETIDSCFVFVHIATLFLHILNLDILFLVFVLQLLDLYLIKLDLFVE